MDTFDRLRQFDMLSHMSGEQLELLVSATSPVAYPEGSQILTEGESGRDLFLIDSGAVRIQRQTPFGRYDLATLRGTEVFGETSFVDDNPRSGDAVAIEPSVLYALTSTALDPLMAQNQRFELALHWALWRSLSHKLRLTNEALAEFFAKKGASPPQMVTQRETQRDFKVGLTAKKELFRQQALSPMEINFLATLSREKKYKPDEYLFREGEPGDSLYIVLDGRVMISKEIVGAGEEALAFMGRGDYFGEMALIDDEPRSADAKAAEDGAVVLTIPRAVLEGILDIQKVSSMRLLRLLCGLVAKRLREIDDKLVGWYIFSAGSGDTLAVPS